MHLMVRQDVPRHPRRCSTSWPVSPTPAFLRDERRRAPISRRWLCRALVQRSRRLTTKDRRCLRRHQRRSWTPLTRLGQKVRNTQGTWNLSFRSAKMPVGKSQIDQWHRRRPVPDASQKVRAQKENDRSRDPRTAPAGAQRQDARGSSPPMLAAAGGIGSVPMFRNDPFEPHPARGAE